MDLDLHALQTSFDLIAPRGDELMDEFYARLFEVAPAVRPLFAGIDLPRQKTMLLGTSSANSAPGRARSKSWPV
jgi:hemoglobin-like flavoprotein